MRDKVAGRNSKKFDFCCVFVQGISFFSGILWFCTGLGAWHLFSQQAHSCYNMRTFLEVWPM